VERYGAMAAGIGWTRGVVDQAGLLDCLIALPRYLRLQLPDGTAVLGVHASPLADDGTGIEPDTTDEQLRPLLAGCEADVVIGGHTHAADDRFVDSVRALNPGSAGMPRTPGVASWFVLEHGGSDLTITRHCTPFDVGAVVSDLHRRHHPNAEFVTAVISGGSCSSG